REGHRHSRGKQHADGSRRTQIRKGREGRELSPRGTAVWQLHPLVYFAEHGRWGQHHGGLRPRCVEVPAGQESGSKAEADQGQRGQRENAGRQGSRESGIIERRASLACPDEGVWATWFGEAGSSCLPIVLSNQRCAGARGRSETKGKKNNKWRKEVWPFVGTNLR